MEMKRSHRKRLLCLNLAVVMLLTALFCAPSASALVENNKLNFHSNIPGQEDQTKLVALYNGNDFTSASSKLRSDVFSRTGFVIVGWSKNQDGSGDWYVPDQYYRNEKNKQLLTLTDVYAQWAQVPADSRVFLPQAGTPADVEGLEPKFYVETPENGTEEHTKVLPESNVFGGSMPVLLWNASPSSYERWYTPGSEVPETDLPQNKYVYGVVQLQNETYTIFDGNGGTSTVNRYLSDPYQSPYTFYTDSQAQPDHASQGQYVSRDLSGFGDFTREGYVLDSWNTEKDGTGTVYYSSEPAVQQAPEPGVRILYAQWVKVEDPYIRYRASAHIDPHGYYFSDEYGASGLSADSKDYVLENSYPADSKVTLPDSTLFTFDEHYYLGEKRFEGVTEGVKLIGWKKQSVDGYQRTTSYYGPQETAVAVGTTDFHAVWGYNSLVFDYNYGDEIQRRAFFTVGNSSLPGKAYHNGTSLDFTPEPYRSGYYLKGWNTQKDGSGDMYQIEYDWSDAGKTLADSVKGIPFGITLYAQWGEGTKPVDPPPVDPPPVDPPPVDPPPVTPPITPPEGGGTTDPGPEQDPEEVPEEVVQKAVEQFPDIADHWGKAPIAWAFDKKLFEGVSANTFAPNVKMDRGMFATVLYRLAEKPAVSGETDFSDVKENAYYSDAVAWAAANEIINGVGDRKFAPKDNISREEMAVMLYRFAKSKGDAVEVSGNLKQFSDADQVSSWAREAMEWAVGEGLLNGKGGGKLEPKAGASRAEVATILMRFA